jgi:hypothetical protein
MPTTKLSDAQLRQLYFNIAKHYKNCRERNLPPQQIYNELYFNLHNSLNDRGSTLYQLSPDEKLNTIKILNTFCAAAFRGQCAIPAPIIYYYGLPLTQVVAIQTAGYHHYCMHNDFLFTWLLLRGLNHPHYHYPPHTHAPSHRHTHPSAKSKEEDQQKAILLLVALAVLTAASTFVALYYLWREIVNSVERFQYNEGWMQASISLLGGAVGGIATGILMTALVAAPLATLALTAGVANPIGLAIFGVVCLSIIGAAFGCFITNQIQNYVIKQSNPDALDAADPHRFTLTEAEANHLMNKGIDPIKVKCAILALRAEMEIKDNKPVPYRLSFCCGSSRTQHIQGCLDKIRELRSGKIKQLKIGDMVFDCAYTDTRDKYAYSNVVWVGSAAPHVMPSAPPAVPLAPVDDDNPKPMTDM